MMRNRTNINYSKTGILFFVISFIYIIGLLAGCFLCLENASNMAFVENISLTALTPDTSDIAGLSRYKQFLLRDMVCIFSVYIFKYAGILKGLCLCIPFIQALQNGCITSADIISNQSLFTVVSSYILRNTATSFILLILCTNVVKDIINCREEQGKDIKNMIIYLTGTVIIFVIDYSIKGLFS